MKNKQISCTSRHHSFYNPVCSVKKCPKSHDATQKNVLMWCISMYHMIGLKQTCGIENVSLKVAKKICECRGLLGRVVLGLLFSPPKPQQQWKTKTKKIQKYCLLTRETELQVEKPHPLWLVCWVKKNYQ